MGFFRVKRASLRCARRLRAARFVSPDKVAPQMSSTAGISPGVFLRRGEKILAASPALILHSLVRKRRLRLRTRRALDMMLQPAPRGRREVSFMNGRVRGEEGGRHCADASSASLSISLALFSSSSSLSLFVNGRAERGREREAEMRRLHFYEWGGLRMKLRMRDAEIFMNGKKWRMRRVCERGKGERRRWGLFLVTRAMSGLIYIKSRLIGCGAALTACSFI